MKPENPLRLTLLYSLPFVLIITVLFVSLLIWEERHIEEEQTGELRETAFALVQQITLTRVWNAGHGGLYAEVGDRTRPNPWLSDPERDIVSMGGKRYTKVNPAYMTREIAELSQARLGYRIGLTSLKPLNPANKPDGPWEAEALKSFDSGATEQMIIEQRADERFFRFLSPLKLEKPCLRCHEGQHYRIGDTKGGISVTIPMKESDRVHGNRLKTHAEVAVTLWTIIVTFIVLLSWTLSRKVAREMAREFELDRLKTAVELAGAAAHEIRQPLTVLIAFAQMAKAKFATDPETEKEKEFDMMIKQCMRIDETISRMQHITEYRTKQYVGDLKITDLGVDAEKYDP
jgi:uncharacterized protein DUF3365/phospho-acceptor domain-containing protein